MIYSVFQITMASFREGIIRHMRKITGNGTDLMMMWSKRSKMSPALSVMPLIICFMLGETLSSTT
jgi:hypothetical protein